MRNLVRKLKSIKINLKSFLRTIKGKLIITYILIAFIPIFIVSILTYSINKNILISKIGVLSNNYSIQTTRILDNYVSEVENAASLVFANEDISSFNPSNSNMDTYEIEKTKRGIREYLLSIELLKEFTDFSLVYQDGTTIGKISKTTKSLYGKTDLYSGLNDTIENAKSKSMWLTGINGDFKKIYYVKQVNSYTIMIASIYAEYFDEIFKGIDDGSNSTMLLLDDNNVIYSNNSGLVGTMIDDKIKARTLNSSSEIFEADNKLTILNTCKNGWKFINFTPNSYILKEVYIIALITIIIAIICMIGTGIFGALFANKISNPIRDVVIKMKKAEEGDLTVKSSAIGNDEVATLSNSFNNMIKNIRKLVEDTKNFSSVVLNKSDEIKEISKQNHDLSKGITEVMEGIAVGTTEQSVELDKTVDVVENLSQKINDIVINISNATQISNETKIIGDKSLEIIRKQQIKNGDKNKIMEEIFYNIQILVDSIKEIEKVIELMDSISQQTNLLSLNASIEAVRAGEYGKGFSVVAGEVKKLANQSKMSTNNVYEIIKSVYEKANLTIKLVNLSKDAFKESNEFSNFANNSFINIIDGIEKIDLKIRNIEIFMKDINREKDKNIIATNNMRIIVEKEADNAEEALATTEQQNTNARVLEERVIILGNSVEMLSDSLNKFII